MSYKADSDTDASSRNEKLYRGKAPIASMDAMEDMDLLSGSNTHLSKLSSECNMGTKGIFPGLKYRHLGKSGFKVSNLILGSTKIFNGDNPESAEEIITTAYENGINHFDISDPYQVARSEQELGRILRKKGWPRRSYYVSTRIYWHNRGETSGLNRKEIIEAVKESLQNFNLGYIDLVLVHKTDPNCPIEEVVRAMTYLINNGMIMYWGTARWGPVEIYECFTKGRELGQIGPICELGEYHWFHREKVEVYMAELYNKVGIGLMTWSPVSFGLCPGDKTDDASQFFIKLANKSQKFSKVMDSVNLASEGSSNEATNRVKALGGVAERIGCTLTQLSLAWCVRNQTSQVIIISATSPDHLIETLNSLAVVPKLTHHVNEDIDKILGNKPARPPMISTLQQRWATTGGVPPC